MQSSGRKEWKWSMRDDNLPDRSHRHPDWLMRVLTVTALACKQSTHMAQAKPKDGSAVDSKISRPVPLVLLSASRRHIRVYVNDIADACMLADFRNTWGNAR